MYFNFFPIHLLLPIVTDFNFDVNDDSLVGDCCEVEGDEGSDCVVDLLSNALYSS